MVIARLSLGLSFLGLQNFLKLCHDEKPCTWWLGEKGLGSLQSRLARMLHHEYDALKGYRFLGGAISFYSVSCMSDVIFNPSLLNWSSLILTVAHMYVGRYVIRAVGREGGMDGWMDGWHGCMDACLHLHEYKLSMYNMSFQLWDSPQLLIKQISVLNIEIHDDDMIYMESGEL